MRAAMARTAGQILTWEDAPAQVFYTASCGGMTERAVRRLARRRRIRRTCDRTTTAPATASRTGRRRFRPRSRPRAARRRLPRARPLRDVKREGRTASGRVESLHLAGLAPEQISAQDFRTIVGRSARLAVDQEHRLHRDADRQRVLRFDGHGFGHGVGLCVLGSVGRAEHGDSAKAILDAYFPGLKIRTVDIGPAPVTAPTTPAPTSPTAKRPTHLPHPPHPSRPAAPDRPARPAAPVAPVATRDSRPGFTLVLPSDAESRPRRDLSRDQPRAGGRHARRPGAVRPADLRVVFHPTTASFQRETGESWWIGGEDARQPYRPPAARRAARPRHARHDRAPRDRARAHGARPRRAADVGEGRRRHALRRRAAAAVARRERRHHPAVKCPSDLDLRRPASAALARQAYGLAAACFERALAGTGDWTKVRIAPRA